MVRDIPEDIHRKYKALCTLEGRNMSGTLLAYMRCMVEAHDILEEVKHRARAGRRAKRAR